MRSNVVVLGLVVSVLAGSVLAQDAPHEPSAKSKELHAQGMSAGNAGKLAEAVKLFEQAIEADPKNHLAHFDLGGAHEALKKKDEALACYRKTVELRPDFTIAQEQLGTLHMLHKRQFDEAIACFRAVLLCKKPLEDPRFARDHTRAQTLLNLGIAYAMKGQLGVAVGIADSGLHDAAASRALDQKLKGLSARAGNDVAKNAKRDHSAVLDPIRKLLPAEAKQAGEKYLEFEKSNDPAKLGLADRWDLYEGLGLALAIQGQHEAGLAAFEKARAAAEKLNYPLLLESTFNVACCLSELKKTDEALHHLETILWLELATAHDPLRKGKKALGEKMKSDDSLKNVRETPGFTALVARYAP